jgi:putative ABC transport system permease protein
MRMTDRLFQDLRIACRALARQRTFSVVAILTLALGVGATTAIFSVVYGILLRPLPYAASDRIVAFGQTARSAPQEPVDGSSSPVNFQDWQWQSRTIPLMALYSGGSAVISDRDEATVVRIGSVTPGFFAVFGAAPIMGREFSADESRFNGPRAAIVSHGYWQERLGGRADVLEQRVDISGVPWPIVGVAPRGFDFPNNARVWLPVRNNDEQCGRDCVYLNGIGRLAAGATVEAAQQEMAGIAAALEREFPGSNTDVTVLVQSLHDRTVGNVRLALIVLLGAVAMVLLIACANVANLVLVRGAARQGEIAVRTALGAGRRGLVSYLLTENLMLALAGGAVGVVLAIWGVSALKAVAPDNLPRLDAVTFDVPTFLFSLAIVMLTTVFFGLGPSLQLAGAPLVPALGQRGAIGARRSRWTRSLLLVAEVGLSLVLLLGAGLLLRSLTALQDTELGFDPDNLTVFMVSLPPARYPAPQVIATHEQLDEQLRAMPGVTRVARISGLPLGVSENVLTFTRPDQPPPPPGQAPVALYRVVDPEYFETMKISLLAGRVFAPTDRQGAPRAVIVSRRMADVFWPGEDPIGRPILISGQDPATVVGIVANVRSQAVARQADPEMYVPHAQSGLRSIMYVVQGPADSAQVLSAARQVVRRLDARLPLIFPASMSELVDDQLARPRFYLVLLGLFAVLAVVLAAVGIYGVVAYVVTQRTREIGVRMALGARQREVVTLMLWQGLRPAALGMALGLGVAIAIGRVMQGLLYEVQPHDPLTFAGVSALLIVVVLVACAIPARRASAVPPAEALRME